MCKTRKAVWRCWTVALVLASIVLAAGCGKATDAVELDAGDNGAQVTVEKGQTLVVTLDSNPTTGYSWAMVPTDDGILEQVGEAEFSENPRSKGKVGAGGTETLRFEAKKTGQTRLELVYRRPWEQGEKPLETFAVQVTVE
jgi:inhibitor of cysteine peptidase